jgi:hypothetical protein
MVMALRKNSGKSHNLLTANKSSEYVTKLKHLGKTATNENHMREEMISRSNWGSAR